MHAVVFHTHCVHTRLGGNKTDAVGVVFSLHDFCLVNLAWRAGHLSSHIRYADLWKDTHTSMKYGKQPEKLQS